MLSRVLYHAYRIAKEEQTDLNVQEHWPSAVDRAEKELREAYAGVANVNADHIFARTVKAKDAWVLRSKQYLHNHYGSSAKRRAALARALKWKGEIVDETPQATTESAKRRLETKVR